MSKESEWASLGRLSGEGLASVVDLVSGVHDMIWTGSRPPCQRVSPKWLSLTGSSATAFSTRFGWPTR